MLHEYGGTGPSTFNRSDYLDIYHQEGADALTRAIRDRILDPKLRERELLRMNRFYWIVFWDPETGEGSIVGRREGA